MKLLRRLWIYWFKRYKPKTTKELKEMLKEWNE